MRDGYWGTEAQTREGCAYKENLKLYVGGHRRIWSTEPGSRVGHRRNGTCMFQPLPRASAKAFGCLGLPKIIEAWSAWVSFPQRSLRMAQNFHPWFPKCRIFPWNIRATFYQIIVVAYWKPIYDLKNQKGSSTSPSPRDAWTTYTIFHRRLVPALRQSELGKNLVWVDA